MALALALSQATGCVSLRERLFGKRMPTEPTLAPAPTPVPSVPGRPGGVWGDLHVIHADPGGGDLGTAIVYLERIGAGGPAPEATAATLSFDGRGHVAPTTLAAAVGHPIRVEFQGGVLHQPFTLAEDGSRIDFVPDENDAEAGGQLLLDQPGVFRIYCSLHGDEHGMVYAVRSPLFSLVGDDGRYGIEPVPVGAYRLVLWSEAVSGSIRSIEVESGAHLESPIWIDARQVER